MCDRPPSPRTGAPTSATEPVSAQASAIGRSSTASAVVGQLGPRLERKHYQRLLQETAE